MLGSTLGASYSGSNIPREQGLEPHQHSLDTVEVVLKLVEAKLLESMFTADDPHKPQQQQYLSVCLLLQD